MYLVYTQIAGFASFLRTKMIINYRKVASTSPSRLEAHANFFRLSMKVKFDVYFDFHIINAC